MGAAGEYLFRSPVPPGLLRSSASRQPDASLVARV